VKHRGALQKLKALITRRDAGFATDPLLWTDIALDPETAERTPAP
jgi:hypothetical protein